MPDYQYTARELTGDQVTGVISATTQQDALASLSLQQLFPIRVDLADEAKAQQKYVGRKVKSRVLAIFYAQLADLLKSGVPLLRSLELLREQTSSPALKLVLEDVHTHVSEGTPLFEAMKQHPKCFGELVVSMVRAGEEGGFLEDVLKRVAGFTEHQEELKGRVVGAMVYPVFLLVFGGAIVTVLLVYFVPKFEPIFARMSERGSLPWATTALLSFSELAQSYWLLGVVLLVAAFFALRYAAGTPLGRQRMDYAKISVYGFGRIMKSLSIARFCRILGTLLNNGVPILQSLRIAKDATANVILAEAIDEAADNVSEGKSLAKPLSKSGHFPKEIVEMISVGEEANNLEDVLIGVADNLERRTNRELDVAVRMLEPLLLLVMAAIVLFVVIALLLPIMQSSGIV